MNNIDTDTNITDDITGANTDTSTLHPREPSSLTSLLTNELLEKIVKEVRKKENMDKIHGSIIDPLIQYTYNKNSIQKI